MKVPNNFLLYVTILSLSLVLVSRGIRDLAYPNTFTRHVNDQLRERGTLSGPQPPDPESEIEIAGHKLDRNYYGGPYYFAGTKVRAGWKWVMNVFLGSQSKGLAMSTTQNQKLGP